MGFVRRGAPLSWVGNWMDILRPTMYMDMFYKKKKKHKDSWFTKYII